MARRRFSISLPPIASGMRAAWQAGYGLNDLRQDVLAGLTIGTVAVPLSMALAIATGVPPQHGLYTAIVAGVIIALTGGTRFNVSGPTAAFVVILFPVVKQFGLGGLLLASMMAGVILLAMGVARLGRLIQFVPYPVVLGFTAGIAVVIAVLQIPDLLGLETRQLGEHFLHNITLIAAALPTLNPLELTLAFFCLGLMLIWPRLNIPLPAPLVGLVAGALAAYALNHWFGGNVVDTIASRFTWQAGGESGTGIPPIPPTLIAPWQLPGPNGEPLVIDYALFRALLGPAFAIAMLGAIESLLCAVVADGLSKTRHDPNAELIGQGLGNILAPLFGGITATAAIARTATNVRSGARSPIAAVIHSLVVLLAVVALAGLLGLVPMAALAALLLIVAWNMSEARHVWHTIRSAPVGDVAVLLTCFSLTVLFDMVLAVAVGVGLAAALFIRRMAQLTRTDLLADAQHPMIAALPKSVAVYDINGPLFFAVAEKALRLLHRIEPQVKVIILDLHDVPSMDASAMVALQTLIADLQAADIQLILAGMAPHIRRKLLRAGVRKIPGQLGFARDLEHAGRRALGWLEQPVTTSSTA
ncbi:C4-dicarboxylic acid transporter DauA [Halopseudomonas salegens]|uniref:Sulfate permease, SulP family n=1 Tax=Halopseudomonas salegens TaxID=1434072 RepID=A0A1H2HSC5_9GAMM|nr:C4-dicarboxylic acid transporter DauA [Halopseudomonas salegens]SDU34782.1 sulfate permease, SulP family [Halopseudomonas salegens]